MGLLKTSCQCGQVQGEISHSEMLTGNHFICMCDDCQAYTHHLGKAKEVLDTNGGTDIVPIHPAYFKFTSGFEKVRVLKLRENGMHRWYADCCKMPIGNTMGAKAGYIGLLVKAITTKDKELGPPMARVLAKFGIPPFPEGTSQKANLKMILFVIKFMVRSFFQGLGNPTPFFDAKTFEPVIKPHVLSNEELRNAQSKLKVRV